MRRVVVLGGVLVLRGIAAAHVPTTQTKPQVDPAVACFNAIFTHMFIGRRQLDLIIMLAVHRSPLLYESFCLRNLPVSSSSKACRSCSCVFITMGPYHATGSCSGFPETSRNRIPSSPACTVTSSPLSKSTRERLSASVGGVVSAH